MAYVFQKYSENFIFQLFTILQQFTREIYYFLKKQSHFSQFLLCFLFINKTLRLNNLKTRTDMNAKISVFIICVGTIINFLLYDLDDCTLKRMSYMEVKTWTRGGYLAEFSRFKTTWFWIFSLKKWNEQMPFAHFKMETINSILIMIAPNCYMAKLDIKNP